MSQSNRIVNFGKVISSGEPRLCRLGEGAGRLARAFRTAGVAITAVSLGIIGLLVSPQTLADSGTDTAKRLFADTGVTTNNVEHGITQSQQSWSLQSSFGYKFGEIARMGLSGDSVQFPDGAENLNLRLFFGVKFDLTASNSLLLRYDFNRYFQSGSHNGSIVSAEDRFLGYHVAAEQNSNWEGLGSTSTWFGFGKEFELGSGYIFEGQVGYTEVNVTGYKNFFDFLASVGTSFSDIFVKLSATTTSQPSEFNGRGGSFLFLSADVKFQ